ncbi:MAG TPA: PAS domain S-box protein [Syntrophomonadaceae bacterium]|nr:PAS domain S-box protein [Syntrophomonadaceae bacterium]
MGNLSLTKDNLYSSILQDLEDIVCCFNSQGIIIYVNASAAEMLGLEQSELVGYNLGDLNDSHFRFLLKQAIQAINIEQPLLEYEYPDTQLGDNPQWYRWKVKGLFNGLNQLEEIYAVGREISYQKKYEKLVGTYQENPGKVLTTESWPGQHEKAFDLAERVEDERHPATFHQLTDITPACIIIIQDNRYLYVNNFFTNTMGYQFSELANMNALDLIHPDYRGQVLEELEKIQNGLQQIFRLDIRVLPRDGSVRWLDISGSVFQWEGKPALLGAAYDVTRRIELQSALIQSENNFRQLADTAPNLIFVLENSRLTYVNTSYIENTGYSEQECLQMEPWEFFHPQHQDMIRKMAEARKRGAGSFGRFQTRMLPKDEREAWADFTLSGITFNGQPATLGVAIDITEQKRALREVEYLSYHDKLTGLYNRVYLEDKAQQLDNDSDLPLTIIMGDVNGLKVVNDAFGHHSGDLMLKKVAEILLTNCRETDIVARWGGDEFVIMLPHSTEETARSICTNVYQACFQIKDFPIQVSIALGMTTKTDPAQSMEDLFKEAEDLMYRNKMLENRSIRSSFLNSLEQTLWVRSHETQEHTARLCHLVLSIGQSLCLPSDEMNNLTLLASLHDIGKIAIPNSILDKPGPLTPDEWDLIKKHPEIGYRIAQSHPELSPIAEAILNHHERWDGSGYPLGAKGQEIPLISRILALADAYDVMISGRPYQQGISSEKALQEIITCAGTQFDPDLAQTFIDIMRSNVIQ